MKRGFSLIEILIVISIIVIIGVIGSSFFIGYTRDAEIKSVSQSIVYDLRQAQSRSMAGENDFKWGIHFVNGAKDYYEIFSTPTDYNSGSKTVLSTVYLNKDFYFSNPAEGVNKDIIFNKISGWTNSDTLVLNLSNTFKTINISSIGSIFIQ